MDGGRFYCGVLGFEGAAVEYGLYLSPESQR